MANSILTPEESTNLYDMLQQFSSIHYGSTAHFKKSVRKRADLLAKSHREAIENNDGSAADQTFIEHYFLLQKMARESLKNLNRKDLPVKNGIPDVYLFAEIVLSKTDSQLSTAFIMACIDVFQSVRYLTNSEHEFLKAAFSIAILNGIVNERYDANCENNLEHYFSQIYALESVDFEAILNTKNHLEELLKQDPSGDYPKMDRRTRAIYRYKVNKLAVLWKKSDEETVKNLLEMNQQDSNHEKCQNEHIGFQIYKEYNLAFHPDLLKAFYIPVLFVTPIALSLMSAILLRVYWLPVLTLIPFYEICKQLIDLIYSCFIKSEYQPRMRVTDKLLAKNKTVLVLSTVILSRKDIDELIPRLEDLYYKTFSPYIGICVLADLKSTKYPELLEDRALLQALDESIKRLNNLYGNYFTILVRKRKYSKTQEIYSGFDRKRGAICDLVRLMNGETVHFYLSTGNMEFIKNAKYLLTLDSDTIPLLESVQQLVGVAAHPLNQPVIDTKGAIVQSGYGIFVPRVSSDLSSVTKTPFAKIMGGQGGIHAYDPLSPDIYQDLFGESIFAGKGLINAQLFYQLVTDVFIDETVLSHDILEGAFLRTCYVSDIEFLDSFPSTASAYFKRQHRWIRGDAQNTCFLFSFIPTKKRNVKNPLGFLNRYKLFDNLRRALTPLFSLFCLITAFFISLLPLRQALIWTAFLATTLPYLLGVIQSFLYGGASAFTSRYYSGGLSVSVELLLKAFFSLLFLPDNAFLNTDALIRGWYRRGISHKNMLEWTTAAQSEKVKSGISKMLRTFFFSILTGVFFLLSPYGSLRLIGIIFLFAFFAAVVSSEPYATKTTKMAPETKEQLISEMARMFHFYQVYANEEEHFLPPDNVQFAPVYRIAHRTSPTNIGFMMLSVLAARDCDIIDDKTMLTQLENTLDTVEKLEKWHGNLYNWYDTRTLSVLSPKFISVVDCGNFLCAMTALKEGLKEYAQNNTAFAVVIDRIIALIESSDLSLLFDEKKNLFSIGYNTDDEILNSSHYDMLMSEARMTSFFAIAKKLVPVSHWGALSRRLGSLHSYKGPVSWTGTMFEYFMPEIFLSSTVGSLGYEALRFCLYVQRSYAEKLNVPYGISESGIYSFDADLNYQYKANGVQRIALKSHMNDDVVVSPYSSYLSLPFCTKAAMNNLSILNKMGMFGRFGFYESVDFTSKRVGEKSFELIKSFMAHHIGMSILAVDNAINNGIIQKRFLSDRQMKSAKELLQEKITNGTELYNEPYIEKVTRMNESEVTESIIYTKVYPQRPRVKVLSNQELTALYTDSGVELMFYRNQDILRRTTNLLQKPNGFFALLKTADNIISLTEAPFYGKKIDREIRFKDDAVTYIARTEEIETELSAHISRSAACEVKTIRLENRENQSKEAELLIYLEPALALQSDDAAHLAFSKLFIEIKKQAESNIVVARRKTRMGENSLYLAVGFAEDMAFEIESNRENVLRSPQGIFSLPEAFDANFSSKSSGVPDPCIALRVKFHLSQRGKTVFHFILSVGQTFQQAIDGVIGSRLSILSSEWNPAVTPLLQHTVVGRLADAVIPQLFFEGRLGTKTLEASEKNILPRNTLWKFGISGDFPIVLVELTGEEDKDRVLNYIELHQMLKQVGIISDLVFVYAKNSDKSDLVSQMYTDLSLRELRGNYRVGKDHLFYIDLTKELPEMICFFRAVASHIASLSLSAINIPPDEYLPITVHPVLPDNKIPEDAIKVINGAFYRHSFFAESGTKLPWSHILANDMFGTLLTNKSLGYTWAVNSRENKLTPWSNDTMADHSGEFLILKIDETYYNLCNGAQVEFSPGSAVYRGKVSNLSYELSVTVDTSDSRKRIELTFKNHSQSEIIAECAYYTEPIFSADGRYRRFLIGTQEGKRCILQNPFASIFESSLELSAKEDNCFFCFNSVDFFSGRWNKTKQTLPNSEPCAAIICPFEITGKGNKTISFTMEYKENGKLLKAETIKPSYKFQIKTPDKTLNALFNTWIPYQTEVCRMTARTGFYQCGGAYGFRDQLQDASAVLLWNPEKTRKHILRACIRQFEEGDVLHWWHELPKTSGGVKGVRTTCSDDLVWLPYTVCEYLDKTGDRTILNEKASFVSGESLQEGEQERYIAVETTEKTATVYEHCKLALERAYRIGEHGLPLIGNGDWNDGLNRIGEKGKGESIWLAEFLLLTLRRFSKVSAAEKDLSAEAVFSGKADALDQAISRCAWDGEWYLRAFTDDGDVLGSKNSLENTIDSLPQSFSVFARINPKEHCETALKSAWRYLVDEKAGIIKLFNEPFNGKMKNVGYIRSYPVGVRENGGQYTHAAVWLTMAMLLIGEHEKGYCMVQMLNPANHSLTSEQAQRYLTEPYYLDGDVYANPEQYARGGWSIYTGAAGWYFRCILETLLGFNFSDNTITISPRVPKEWNRWSVDILYKNTKLYINAIRAEQNKILENGIEIKQIDCNGGIRRLDLYYK